MLDIYQDNKKDLVAFKEGEKVNNSSLVKLNPHSKDEINEKHIPVIEVNNKEVTVKIGSIAHPMTKEHLIEDVFLETNKGIKKIKLTSTDAPVAHFTLEDGEKVISSYAFCNIHGLWFKEL